MPGTRRTLATLLVAAALSAAAVPAHASQDAVQFFRTIEVTPDAPVHDAVCFFCNVNVDGQVMGDIVAFFGNITIHGEAHHDVVNFFGHITASDNSSIGEDAVSIFGGVRLGENAHVGRDLVCIFGSIRAPGSATNGGDRVSIPEVVFFGPLIVLVIVVMVIIRELRAYQRRRYMASVYPYPPPR